MVDDWTSGTATFSWKGPEKMTAGDATGDAHLTVEPPEHWATGLPAVRHALQFSLERTSLLRTALNLLTINQTNGVDCPGCAWPEPRKRHLNEYCENGAKHVNDEATTRRITREFFRDHPISVLATKSDMWLNDQGRLTEPMVKRPGADHYVPIDWDDAFELLATELRGLESPDESLFYTSGRLSNEAAFLLQLFARSLGTNNLPDCSNMCHESSGSGLAETLGIGKGSVSLEDLEEADLVFAVGINPGTNMPRMLSSLEETKRNGGQVIAVNPLPEAGLIRFKNPQKARGIIGRGTTIADQFLHIKPGGDLALFQAINALLLAAEDADPGKCSTTPSSTATRPASSNSPSTPGRSIGLMCLPRPGFRARRSMESSTACSPARRSSCAGRWASLSRNTVSLRSARSSTF